MKVLNIHTRVIDQPVAEISKLFKTLASKNDQMWPVHRWPALKLDNGLKIGSSGGHGPIRYSVQKYTPGKFIKFKLSKPKGFNGIHEFEIKELAIDKTELKHSIRMTINGQALLSWPLAIRWLHDALIEDAFDTVENHFLAIKKKSDLSLWVKFLREILKPKKKVKHKKASQN